MSGDFEGAFTKALGSSDLSLVLGIFIFHVLGLCRDQSIKKKIFLSEGLLLSQPGMTND